MSQIRTYRDLSKADYGLSQTAPVALRDLEVGALLRIADAVEKMAVNYDILLAQKKFAEDSAEFARQTAKRLERRVLGLRGYVRRLKGGKR